MSVLYVYKRLFGNESTEIDLTSQGTKCVFRNAPEVNVKSLFYGDTGVTRTYRFIRDGSDKVFINQSYIYFLVINTE